MHKLNIQIIICGRLNHQVTSQFIPLHKPLCIYQVFITLKFVVNFYLHMLKTSGPVGGDIFRTCPDRPWGSPSLLYNGYRLFKVRRGV